MHQADSVDCISSTDSGAVYGKPGLSLLVVETPLCRAVIAEQGAQLLEFQARGREPLLWLSPEAKFEPGRAVRGGIPLCLPWFGIHRQDPGKPKHGLVRNRPWLLDSARALASGEVELRFVYRHPGDELFAAPFECAVTMRLGRELQLQMHLKHGGAEVTEYSWAWHTYFPVADIGAIEVHGLEATDYLDNTRGLARATQRGPLDFPGEVDRIYLHAPAHQRIAERCPINASSDNCHTVIAWNPGAELAAGLDDVGAHFREYVCVEHGNAFDNSWQLEAGESARAALLLSR
ncbi:D-hexose-6-phosphate mutarotase [Microbulbifer sp. SAOS-129_SWC]|uniref:D-hexose-6-phosphate mutarotase n=1 Tax=Microbulbifer sp. SAOS-129_SWC TaxID=3145235 RepID=UPI003216DBB4